MLKTKNLIFTCPFYNAQSATTFTRLEESIQGFPYLPEDQKFKVILNDGNNIKQCASFFKTILEITRSELMKTGALNESYKLLNEFNVLMN